MYCFIVTAVLLMYIFWDVNYFLRTAFTILFGRVFQKKCSIKDSTTIYGNNGWYMITDESSVIMALATVPKYRKLDSTKHGFCTTQDVDIFLRHMNNARYVRELDFARFHFYDRSGIYDNIKAVDGHALQGASTIRYRRTIPIFSAYKVETKLVYWEEKTLFIEQKFVTLSDGFVRAVVLSRQNLININAEGLLKNISGAESKPECPEEIKHWLQAIEISSARLRKKD